MSHLQDCFNFDCPDEFFHCWKSYCIPWYSVKDGLIDCPHGEDENIPDSFFENIFKGYFICHGITQRFIHPVEVCDGVAQCPEGDDEFHCNVTCPVGFKCFANAVMVENRSEVVDIKSFRLFDIDTKFLNLSGLDLSQIDENYVLPKLLELHASSCNLRSLKNLLNENYELLVFKLDLSYDKFTKIGVHDYGVVGLKNLQFLNLARNVHLSVFNGNWLRSGKLKHIDLSSSNISFFYYESINFKALTYLNLSNTKIRSLETLNELRSISVLDIRNTLMSEQNIVQLLRKLTIKSALYVDNFKFCCTQVVGSGIPKSVCHAPLDGISSCQELISDIIKRSLLWLVAFISVVGNIFVLAFRIIYDRGLFKKGYGIFVTNLGISDFIMGIYLTIIFSVDIYFRDYYVIYETKWRASVLCSVSGFLSTLSSETSAFFILLITLDRFLVIRFPFGDYKLKKLVIRFLVVTSWLIGLIMALIPILNPQWTIYSSTGLCLGLPLTAHQQNGWQYAVGVFIVFNCILFLVIAFGQVLIFLSMSSQRITMDTVNAARREQDINVSKQLFIVVLSNFLCWFPICVTGLLSLKGRDVSPDTFAWFIIFVLPLNAAINPMIYTVPAVYNKWKEFKEEFEQLKIHENLYGNF